MVVRPEANLPDHQQRRTDGPQPVKRISSRRQQLLEARHEFFRRVSDTYGHQKTPSEVNIINVVHEQGALSVRLVVSYFFMLWCSCCHYTHKFTFGVDYIKSFTCDCNNSATTTVKPSLQGKKYCNSGPRTYIEVADFYCAFSGAPMDVLEEIVYVTNQTECNTYLKYMNNSTYISILIAKSLHAELRFACNSKVWPLWIKLSSMYGRIVSGILTGLAADMYGRKPACGAATMLQLAGYLIEFYPDKWLLLIGEFFGGFGTIGNLILYVLVLEKCNHHSVQWVGLLAFLTHPLTNFISFVLRYSIKNWRLVHLAETCMLLICPVVLWFMVESPRWLMVVGDRPAAWRALQKRGPVEPNPNDMEKPVADKPTAMRVLSYFRVMVYRDRILICIILYLLCALSLYINRTPDNKSFNLGKAEFLWVLTFFQIIIYIFTYFIAIKLGRRRALFYLHCAVSILDLIVFMAHRHFEGEMVYHIMLYCHMAAAHAVVFVVFFYTVELFPTLMRGTAMGICVSTLGAGEAIQHYFNYVLDPPSDNIAHMPAFIGSLSCALAITFLPVTHNRGLPDKPAEALYLRIFV